ncbi:hypothetical protein CC2G_007798 [Coprinopsis cinerea AmutBmut pab1-1]|nr:hypothetical protein CC2G_007798 [Coprinopsis cinerea AmutBmut pab1-1]
MPQGVASLPPVKFGKCVIERFLAESIVIGWFHGFPSLLPSGASDINLWPYDPIPPAMDGLGWLQVRTKIRVQLVQLCSHVGNADVQGLSVTFGYTSASAVRLFNFPTSRSPLSL